MNTNTAFHGFISQQQSEIKTFQSTVLVTQDASEQKTIRSHPQVIVKQNISPFLEVINTGDTKGKGYPKHNEKRKMHKGFLPGP